MQHAWERKFLFENLKGRDYLADQGTDEKLILKRILEKYGGKVWTGLIWLRIGPDGGLLWTW
jgi:hypothetical protein